MGTPSHAKGTKEIVGFALVAVLLASGFGGSLTMSIGLLSGGLFRRDGSFLGNVPYGSGKALPSQPSIITSPADSPTVGRWSSLGPAPMNCVGYTGDVCSGRVTAIAVSPGPSHPGLYVGGAQGGVWKLTGSTWFPLMDDQPSLAIGSIAVDPTGNLYVGTGEANGACTSSFGAGVLKSTDGGNTWVQIGASTFGRATVAKIVVMPDNADVILVSTTRGFTNSATWSCQSVDPLVPMGLYLSRDGGSSWTLAIPSSRAIYPPGTGDIAIDPTNSSRVFAAVDGTVYLSEDKGSSWNALAGGLPASNTVGRVALAVSKSSAGMVFAAVQNLSFSFPGQGELFRSKDGGSTWSIVSTPTPTNFCGPYNGCEYNFVLAVDPADASTIYVGGNDLYRTNDGGSNWTDLGGLSGFIHPDQHALAFDPESHTTIYIGNDGGIWSSANGNSCSPGACWTDLNSVGLSGLGIAQFYSVAPDPTSTSIELGGTQDNGVLERTTESPVWNQLFDSDGGWTAFDPDNASILYATTQRASPQRSDDGGLSWNDASTGINHADSSQFMVPMAIDPTSPGTLFLGTYRLYKTTNRGGNWVLPNPGLSLPGANCAPTNGDCITAIAVAPSNGQFVYVGTKLGRFFVSTDGGVDFVEQDVSLPSRFITKVAVDPINYGEVFIAFSGFGGKHVFATANSLALQVNWTDISSSLPDFSATAVAVGSGGVIYAGMDDGAFVSATGGANWSRLGIGLPSVPVYDLKFTKDGSILAATHGRGVWILPSGPAFLSVVKGSDGGLYHSEFLSNSWNGWASLTGAALSAPALCSSSLGRVEVVVRGIDNAIYHKSFLNGVWSSSWDSPGGLTNDQPSCTVLNNKLHVVVRGMDDGIWYNSLSLISEAWSGWVGLKGTTASPPGLVGSSNADRLDLVVRGMDNGIWHKGFVGDVWATSWDSPGGSASSTPAVASDDASLQVVVRGADNGIYYNRLPFGGSWGAWQFLDGLTLSPPGLALDSAGTIQLVVSGVDNGIYHKSKPSGGSWSSSWDSPSGSTSQKPAIATEKTMVQIVVKGTDTSIYGNTLLASNWAGWKNLGGSTNDPPALVAIA